MSLLFSCFYGFYCSLLFYLYVICLRFDVFDCVKPEIAIHVPVIIMAIPRSNDIIGGCMSVARLSMTANACRESIHRLSRRCPRLARPLPFPISPGCRVRPHSDRLATGRQPPADTRTRGQLVHSQ